MFKNRVWVLYIVGIIAVLYAYFNISPVPSTADQDHTRKIYMSAVEYKGKSNVKKEPFPQQALPEGGGYKRFPPDNSGDWEVETYRFEPGLIVATEGENVELYIFGVNGNKHRSSIEGYDIDFVVERGKLTKVAFKADKPGIYNIVCYDHLPSMQSQLLILPRK